MKNNKEFRQHSSIFHHAATTITIVDLIYILILCPSVEYPWLTAFLIAMFALINVPTIKLSEKKNENYMYYSLLLTLIPLFSIGLLSGSEMPGWLPAFSLITAVEMFFLNTILKHLMHIVIIIVVGLAQYLVGTEFFDIFVILGTLSIVTLLTSNIFSFINKRLNEIEKAKIEIAELHKHTRDSIAYASLIQSALVPDEKVFKNYFTDSFRIWNPKDIVGGDIYLFEGLRNDDECLLMVVDCTGHGVPGAFVTMLVKAIERQITSKINYSDEEVSPAKILSIFNRNMKQLLKQESIDSISNAGFDGGIIYYNKKDKIIKYAGAETPLFYMEDGELKTIKGNRYSVGYKKCKVDYEYKEHVIEVKDGMQFYLTTDGYLDQNGGEKGFQFGKKRFKKIIEENYKDTMSKQQKIFVEHLKEYQGTEETNDDVTLIGFKI